MKRTLSLLLCIALVMGLLPATALAAEDAPETSPAAVSEDVPAPIAEDAPAEVSDDAPAPIANYSDATGNPNINIAWNTDEGEDSWDSSSEEEPSDPPEGVTCSESDGTHTLTLTNKTNLTHININDWGDTPVVIEIVGNNTITPSVGEAGLNISASHNVTIKGTSGAKLTITANGFEEEDGTTTYSAPLVLDDTYVVQVEPGQENNVLRHPYPGGKLVISGVELNLTNTNKQNNDETYAFAALGNVELTNGAKITTSSLQGIEIMGNFKIDAGCEVKTDALSISGFYDENDENAPAGQDDSHVRKLTVNGTLDITGSLNGVVDENAWCPSLWLLYAVDLELNEGGSITVNDSFKDGTAVIISSADWHDPETNEYQKAPAYLTPSTVHIKGGTFTVNGVKSESCGISLDAGTKWVQTAGTVTVNIAEDANSGPCGISISGNNHAWNDDNDRSVQPASFEQSGGVVNVNFSNVNIPGDKDHHGVVCVTNSGNLTLSGSAKFNVTISGTDNHWSQGVQTRMDTDDDGNVLPNQTAPTMTVKDSAALTVDMSELTGTGEDAGFLGLNAENGTFNIADGTVTVKLPGTGKTANGVNGIQVSSSKLNITGGKVDITETGGTLRELRGITLQKYNWEDENSPASELNMSGGSVNISLKPTMQDDVNLCGISNWDEGIASITGGAVTIDVTGALSDEQEHYDNLIWGIESTGKSLTVGSGAKLDITGGFTGTYKESDESGWLSFHGIDIRERNTYTQSGEVTIKPADGNVSENDSYGLNAENRSTVTVSGKLTITDMHTAVYLVNRTNMEIANGAEITVDAMDAEPLGDGIIIDDYSSVIISGGKVNLDLPIVRIDHLMTVGFAVQPGSSLSITGGEVNINQKAGRTAPDGEFVTAGIFCYDGYARIAGSAVVNITASLPVYWEGGSFAGNFSLANGICAMYTDGTHQGYEVTVFDETLHIPADPDAGYDANVFSVYAYLSGPEAVPETPEEYDYNREAEFGVKISAGQNARPSAPVGQEYSGLLELVNPGTITADQAVTLRMTATLPNGTDTLTLTVENGKIEKDSVSVNGAAPTADNNVSYGIDGKSVTLKINSGDIVRFNVLPSNGNNTVTATVSGKTEEVTFKANALTLELPTATNTPTITVSGVTAAGKEVTVYVNGAAQTTKVTANQAGVWSTTVTFSAPGTYQVQAKTATSSSDVKTVVYNQVVPTVKSLTVTNWVHGRTSADPAEKVESKITYDVNGKITAPKYYIYWPELTRFVFTVEVESGTNIEEMWVNCTDWKGDKETVYLKDDDGDGVWEGEGYFCGLDPDGNEHIVPEHFMVVYVIDLPGGRQTFCTPDSNRPSSCGDPSGYVYEGLESNRLSGVTTTLYKADNENGANAAAWTEAKDFDQQNPLTTDRLGQYLWMVPNGYWQVKYEKAGYDSATSAWMVVPPVRTGVNQNLTSKAAATATIEYVKPDANTGYYIIRFNRPVRVSDVLHNLDVSVDLAVAYDDVKFEGLAPADSGWAETGSSGIESTLCATTFTTDISAYKNGAEGAELQKINIPTGTTITISGSEIYTYMDVASEIEATCKAVTVAPARQSYSVTVTNGSGSGTYTEGETVAVSAEIRAGYEFSGWKVESTDTLTVTGNPATFTMPACDVTLTAQYNEVEKPAESGGSSLPGIFRPNRPTRPGVLSPSDTGVSMTLDVSGSVAFIQGFPDGTVCPDKTLTRAEAVQMIYRLVSNKPATAANPFKDVKDGDWFREAALELAAMGVIKGKGAADTFAPGDTMTRAEFAAVCARLAVEAEAPTTFADVPANHWAAKEIGTAAAYGWINGRDGTHFDPNTGITRAEAAKIINCMIGRAPVTGSSDVTFKDLSPNHWAYGEILAAAQGN